MEGVALMISQEDKTMALLSHVLTFFFGFLAPLVIWLIKKDQSLYAAEHAKESLNFQISIIIYGIIGALSMFILIGFVLLPILGLLTFIFVIIATIKAANGEPYRYPMTIRFVK
jgi:uncharacterized protein